MLTSSEIVHHEDENRRNNSPSNLRLTTQSDHATHHGKGRTKRMVKLRCPECGEEFARERRQTHLAKKTRATFCSRSCRAKFWRKAQSNNGNPGLRARLELGKNVVAEYDE